MERGDFEATLALIGYVTDDHFGTYFNDNERHGYRINYWYFRHPRNTGHNCRCLVRVHYEHLVREREYAKVYALRGGKLFGTNMSPTFIGEFGETMAWLKAWHTKNEQTLLRY